MTNPYDDEVAELFKLAQELNEIAATTVHAEALLAIADKLDDIAKSICEKWTESLP